jgi:hypothetical protein
MKRFPVHGHDDSHNEHSTAIGLHDSDCAPDPGVDPSVVIETLTRQNAGMKAVLSVAYSDLEHLPEFESSPLIFGIIECLNDRDPIPAMNAAVERKRQRAAAAVR